jgi:hypothetical protein
MTEDNNSKKCPDEVVITFKPDATEEQIERFLTDLAYAILAVARHVVDKEEQEANNVEDMDTIDF